MTSAADSVDPMLAIDLDDKPPSASDVASFPVTDPVDDFIPEIPPLSSDDEVNVVNAVRYCQGWQHPVWKEVFFNFSPSNYCQH